MAAPTADIAFHTSATLRFARRLLPQDAAEAEDVAQDVMLAFLKKLPTIPSECALRWLYGATHLTVIERKRRYGRKVDGLARLRDELLGTSLHLSPLETGDLLFDLRRGLVGLTVHQKEVVQLWLEGYCYEEIATHRDISVNTVKDHLKNAFRTIRKAIGADQKGGQIDHG